MDRFIKKPKNINAKISQCTCILGKTGIGKTWQAMQILNNVPFVELTPDILKNKQATVDFLDKLEGTEVSVLLDEFESVSELVGIREITKPPSFGYFIVTSQIQVKFDFEINIWELPVPTPEIIKGIFPNASDDLIAKSGGDLRYVIQGLDFLSDPKDMFPGSKELVTMLISNTSIVNPIDCIDMHIDEPGNIMSIIQENYPDSSCGRLEVIAEQLSIADVFDTKIYEGSWELLPYYPIIGCVMPCHEINHGVPPGDIRPGSSWTKYQNMCMRKKKIKSMISRVPGTRLTYEALLLLKQYEDPKLLADYGFEPSDVDVLNHIGQTKLKAKTVSKLKKWLTSIPERTSHS
jgi:hypothetical protein